MFLARVAIDEEFIPHGFFVPSKCFLKPGSPLYRGVQPELQPNGGKSCLGHAADDLSVFELSGGTLGAPGAGEAKAWTAFKRLSASFLVEGGSDSHARPPQFEVAQHRFRDNRLSYLNA